MTEENKTDYVMVFEAPKIAQPEFRLYYNEDSGKVLFYTCEKPEGKYIVVDSLTFACARHDIVVLDGKIFQSNPAAKTVITKLIVAEDGVHVLKEDISILVLNDTKLETQRVNLKKYEL